MNLIIIPSIIRCVNKSLSYSAIRSEYSPEERFQQILKTITSVKEKIPNSYIALLECSKDIQMYEPSLKSIVDEYINYYKINSEITDAVESIYKGYGESLTIYTYLKEKEKIEKLHNQYDNIIKISGRYFLNTKFDYNKFDNAENIFRYYPEYNVVTTRLYKINKKYFDLYLLNFIRIISECKEGNSIENIIVSNLPYKHIDYLGVSGYIAVNKNEFIDE
jgi:hypothetical protein